MFDQHYIIGILISLTVGVLAKIVYDWLAANRGKDSEAVLSERDESRLIKIVDDVEWIKEAHSKTDSDGLPLWYVPRELTKIAKDSNERGLETNLILKDIKMLLKDNSLVMRDLIKEVQSLR